MNDWNRQQKTLLMGDLLALAVVSIAGFGFHGTLEGASLYRVFAFYFPLALGWILIGRQAGLYDLDKSAGFRNLWRPLWVMVLLGPFATTLRAILLGAPNIVVVFVLVTMGTGAAGMLLWRTIFSLLITRTAVQNTA